METASWQQATTLSSTLNKALGFATEISGTTYIAADQSNIFLSGRNRGDEVDWLNVKTHFGGDHLASASIVVSQPPVKRPQQEAFYKYLAQTGWHVHRHLALKNSDGSLSENEQSVDGDVRKLIRAAADIPECRSILVLSGDGGMTNSVKYAKSKGKKVYVIAWEGTLHPALAAAATAHATIEELRALITRVMH